MRLISTRRRHIVNCIAIRVIKIAPSNNRCAFILQLEGLILMDSACLYFIVFVLSMLAFHLWASNYSWYEWRSLDENKRTNAHQNEPGEEEENMVESALGASDIQTAPKEKQDTGEKWYQSPEWWNVIIQAGLVILAVAGATIYFRQMQANIRQAEASEKQLAAMTNQVWEMEKESRMDKRAWVFVTHTELNAGSVSNTVIEKIIVQNLGKTPATHLAGYINYLTGDGSAEWTHNTSNLLSQKDIFPLTTSLTLSQNDSHFIKTYDIPITAFDGVKTGSKVIVFYGGVQYDDVFNIHHWSQFCFHLDTNLDTVTYEGFHNSSDDAETSQPNR